MSWPSSRKKCRVASRISASVTRMLRSMTRRRDLERDRAGFDAAGGAGRIGRLVRDVVEEFTGAHALVERRRILRPAADDLGGRRRVLQMRANAPDQAAAADGHEDGIEAIDAKALELSHDLHRDGALPRHDVGVVVGRDIWAPRCVGLAMRRSFREQCVATDRMHPRTQGLDPAALESDAGARKRRCQRGSGACDPSSRSRARGYRSKPRRCRAMFAQPTARGAWWLRHGA